MVGDGLITLERVEILAYRGRGTGGLDSAGDGPIAQQRWALDIEPGFRV